MLRKAWMLFINTFTISMTANSGYAIIGVMKNRFVDRYGWFSREEMNNYIAMAQSCPGPMAVSSSMIIGYQSAGFIGAFAAVLGVIIPPFVMMIVVTYFYTFIATNPYVRLFITGMQAGVCALLMDVILGLFEGVIKMKSWFYYLLIILLFLIVRLTDLSVFLLAILCLIIAVVKTLLFTGKMEEKA
ncbi:MAG: chromate transporter [Erysipelotrichaceae bacterium]|nr:chromate transporter [Erysipelotrichaceae bacterium]